jgi:hypothetical protein
MGHVLLFPGIKAEAEGQSEGGIVEECGQIDEGQSAEGEEGEER